MKQNQLDRIIKLVRRTGDRFVIMDKETEETMVLMNLNEYESLLNDTSSLEDLEEEDMLNKLNHDISRWQTQKTRQPMPVWEDDRKESLPTVQIEEILPEIQEVEDLEEIDEIEDDELEDEGFVSKNEPALESMAVLEPIVEKLLEPTTIPLEVGQVEQTFGEETLSGLPEDEEEKFYLEPIE